MVRKLYEYCNNIMKNNIKCVFSSDIDKYSTQTYLSNFNEHPHGDIKEINTNDIPSFDILTAVIMSSAR